MAAAVRSTNEPERVVLEGVPRIHFYEGGPTCPEDIGFPSCLRACLEFLGDGLGCEKGRPCNAEWGLNCGYAYLMGTSGAAAQLVWDADTWDGVTTNTLCVSDDPEEPVRQALASIGYGFQMALKPDWPPRGAPAACASDDEARYRSLILGSIRDQEHPVLAFGSVGPPECGLITGYDGGGDSMVGWSFFQSDPEWSEGLEFEPSGYYRKRDWFAATQGLIVVGEKGPRPDYREVCQNALQWLLAIGRTPSSHGYPSGLKAYDAWSETVMRDDLFSPGSDQLVARYQYHDLTVGMVAEWRWYGSVFLNQMAGYLPAAAPHLRAAADCWVAEHDLMWAVWEFAKGGRPPEEHAKRFSEHFCRERIQPIIRLSGEKYAQALDHLEKALDT